MQKIFTKFLEIFPNKLFQKYSSLPKTHRKLYLDDTRVPKSTGWIIVRSHDEFIDWISKNGVPEEISLDHDLGTDKTGYDCAKWLCEYCYVNGLPLPDWNVHSANPVGSSNIRQLLQSFERKFPYL